MPGKFCVEKGDEIMWGKKSASATINAVTSLPKRSIAAKRLGSMGAFWTLLPVSFWMLCFVAVPLLMVVLVSFFERGTYGGIVYRLTLENYTRMIDLMYLKVLLVSLRVAFFTTLICLILGYPFAYFISNTSKKYQPILLMLIMIPFWTNSLIRTYALIVLFRLEGVINSVLMALGIISAPLEMLYNDYAILLGMVYALFPFMVLPLYTSIEKLDKSLLEAASDLGARPWKSFMRVTLPLTLPGVFAGSILVFIPALGYFFIPDLMGGSKILLISNLIKNQFLTARDWPYGSAVSIILIIITFVLIDVYVKLIGDKNKMEVF